MSERSKIIHLKKFDNGRRTPAEVHRELGIAHQCSTCGDPAAMKAHFIAPEDEFKRREPGLYALAVAQLNGGDPSFHTLYGKMIRIETVYACDLCKVGLKKYAAKKPDWVLVEFDETGLSSSHPLVVQVPGTVT